MTGPLLTLELRREHDVVLARQRARQVAELLGFDRQDQTRLSTAVSEIARNAFKYAGGGKVEFSVDEGPPPALFARVFDQGPGIAHLQAILDGTYASPTGMGLGIRGARRLLEVCEIRSAPGTGTEVLLGKHFPRQAAAPTAQALARVVAELARQRPTDPLEEIQQQNQELLRTLEELRRERERLAHVNRELEETNRGVVALYAELDERADALQRANEIKTRFLSNMTHEFRTPLNSITSLTRILLQKLDGDLASEQEKQIRYIQQSAEALSELVNDLLDLARVEAGKILVRPAEFRVEDLFGALRGMLRPLLAQNDSVDLTFEDPVGLPAMVTDESKVSQILRNFISNALKFTERGEVRVSAFLGSGNTVVFEVADTGIGIREEDQERIFEEYAQVEGPLQARVRGTGLGLPLARKLAGLLGGSIGVWSRPGQGSRFFAVLPITFRGPTEVSIVPEVSRPADPTRLPALVDKLLVIDDDEVSRYLLRGLLADTRFGVLEAADAREGLRLAREEHPRGIFLDLVMPDVDGFAVLEALKADERTRDIPVFIHTSRRLDDQERQRLRSADAIVPKESPSREAQLASVRDALVRAGLGAPRAEAVS